MVNLLRYVFTLMVAGLLIQHAQAQCDPIVNITFGTVDNPNLEGGTVGDYIRDDTSRLAPGNYRLAMNTNEVWRDWHDLRDHTGDPRGLMLIVDAYYTNDRTHQYFYQVPIRLCKNTRFRFSAWIANANDPTKYPNEQLLVPNVRFVIEDKNGQVVAEGETGDIEATATPRWILVETEFDTGNQMEFVLKLISKNRGGSGNDIAVDDIQFSPFCGPAINLDTDGALREGNTLLFCEGDEAPVTIGSETVDQEAYPYLPVYQWQTRQDGEAEWSDMDGERGSELVVTPIHNQWYRVAVAASEDNLNNQLCLTVSDSVRFAQLIPRTDNEEIVKLETQCDRGYVELDPSPYADGGLPPVSYQWQVDDGNGSADIDGATATGFTFETSEPGTYRLIRTATDVCGNRFVTNTYELTVMETIRTRLNLPQDTVCSDEDPFRLQGGEIVNGDMEGVYSGTGVSDGFFYPSAAGPGQHVITFSPPDSIRCGEPSQATITVLDTVSLGPMDTVTIYSGQQATLRPQTNATRFEWSGGSGLDDYRSPHPVASPDETSTYVLTASNAAGCAKRGEVTVVVLRNLIVPNSFTPNGDGFNDEWQIDGLEDYSNVFIQVFNRWGTLVFSSRGYPRPWGGQFKGSPLPAATYYYTISSELLKQPLSGAVTILR